MQGDAAHRVGFYEPVRVNQQSSSLLPNSSPEECCRPNERGNKHERTLPSWFAKATQTQDRPLGGDVGAPGKSDSQQPCQERCCEYCTGHDHSTPAQ
jgi:hypothetical protein